MNEFISEFTLGDADGPTIAIKDSIDIAGHATTAASRALAGAEPAAQHAEVVQRLIDTGWQIVGKTNMHELAFGMTGINDYTGTPEIHRTKRAFPVDRRADRQQRWACRYRRRHWGRTPAARCAVPLPVAA